MTHNFNTVEGQSNNVKYKITFLCFCQPNYFRTLVYTREEMKAFQINPFFSFQKTKFSPKAHRLLTLSSL